MKKLLIAAMTLATLLVAAPQPASAFPGGSFLITCKFVTFGTFDPLTGMASHEHTFAGNLGVQMNSTKQQLLTQSTNCSDSRDHTAYWNPDVHEERHEAPAVSGERLLRRAWREPRRLP